jgi:hypothetical protein
MEPPGPGPGALEEETSTANGLKGWKLDEYDVPDVLGKALLFFEAQESGHLRAGHRVAWRGPSFLADGQADGLSLSGGWFDAGGALVMHCTSVISNCSRKQSTASQTSVTYGLTSEHSTHSMARLLHHG